MEVDLNCVISAGVDNEKNVKDKDRNYLCGDTQQG